jgi:pectinesterase
MKPGDFAFEIHLLPALPAAWPDGSVTGLRARGGFEIDMAWRGGRLASARVRSLLGQPLRARHGGHAVVIPTVKGQVLHLDGGLAVQAPPAAPPVSAAAPRPDAIVAADGSADYATVQEAINKAPQTSSARAPWTILVKPGTYREVVYAQREKRGVRLVGEDAAATIITAALNAKQAGPDGRPIGTFRTATLQIDADDFAVEAITVENSFGPGSQALALRVDGDRVAFRRCRFLGWQDTVLVNRGRHYFEDCLIAGATDFIFGGATAWFENCDIRVDGNGYITAASTPAEAAVGYVFNRCRVTASKDGLKTHLGRPWRPHAATLFMRCALDSSVRPEGWQKWNVAEPARTVRYAEHANTGPGADDSRRAGWSRRLTAAEAAAITPAAVLAGDDGWLPFQKTNPPQ